MLVLSFLFGCAPATVNNAAESVEKPAQRPNFLWIISEDNSPRYLRLFDERGTATPNIEALADQGLVFDNAFSNAPVCSTARSTLALGVYGPRIGTMHHRAFSNPRLPADLKPIYQLIKEAGYYTSNDAKTDFNFNSDDNTTFSHSAKGAHWRERKPGQPFFHIKTWMTTHEKSLLFPLSDVTEKPTRHDPDKVELPPIYPDTELFRYTYARYLDKHQTLDEQVGAMISELEQAGLLEDTFVFYFGDHGGVLPGSKSFAYESGLQVPLVVRIPKNFRHLVSKGMRKSGTTRVEGFVNFVDFAPTLLKLAGVQPPSWHDGKAFLGRDISLADVNQRDTSFGYADRFGEKFDLVRTLRQGNFKYVRNYLPFYPPGLHQDYRYMQQAYQQWRQYYRDGKLNKVQAAFFEAKPVEALYNLEEDPDEINNLAASPEYRTQLLAFRAKLQQRIKAMPDLGFYSESWINTQPLQDIVSFGQLQKQHITSLIDIADLQLQPFDEVEAQLRKVLQSGDECQRYWALLTLSRFGEEAKSLSTTAIELWKNSENSLVKARAIEFLAMTGQIDPVQPLIDVIAETEQQMQVLEILNIAAVMHDRRGLVFDIVMRPEWQQLPAKDSESFREKSMLNSSTRVRLEYLKQSL